MSLPVPNLDDRRFQDLVDDAKRLIQQRCPEWTDHNVSDPGVTLVEAFAYITDQLLYRLNRVPDRDYVRFLELIGVRLFPPTAAHADVTFWLSAPQPETVHIPLGTQVGTVRTPSEPSIVFSTTRELPIVACSLERAASSIARNQIRDHSDQLALGSGFYCFDTVPKAGDMLLVGLTQAVPSCAVTLRFSCRIEGVGVDPEFPPLAWEAWDGESWVACEIESDGTGGLNRDGDVVLHVTDGHVASVVDRVRAGWLRARVTEPVEGQPRYSASPEIRSLTAFTIGGTASAVNAELVTDEVIGIAEGVPGGRFPLRDRPVVPSDTPMTLEVSDDEGWQEWTQVPNFANSGVHDRHFTLDPMAGEIAFGPAVRLSDGTLRHYGGVPTKGARIRVPAYRTGGGRQGNVARRTLTVLKSSIPFVTRVENRRPADGGVDGEDIESAKIRGPILLRTRDRAVTTEDFEHIAREAAPEVARVRCVAATGDDATGAVRVLIVPAVASDRGRIRFEQLLPQEATLERVTRRLDETRLVGTRVVVEPPVYRGVTVVARLRARARIDPARLQEEALQELYRYFHPTEGGQDGTGWPFGRPVHSGEVYAALQRLRGTELVEDVRLFGADPVTGERGKATDRLEVEPHSLVFSYEHQVLVEAAA
ncbi:MAG: putative baseplate assembly protein [Chloroflexi bacterium]|nr:putative baseplate assembly protein [Chloroflexota bacterium]